MRALTIPAVAALLLLGGTRVGNAQCPGCSWQTDGSLNVAGHLGLTTLSADPSSPSAGWLYYNTTATAPKFYNGSSWVTVGSGGGGITGPGTSVVGHCALWANTVGTLLSDGSCGGSTVLRGFIGGFGLNYTNATTVTVNPGVAADSTAASYVSAAASFTLTLTGNMGNGVTRSASTWYHVCIATISGSTSGFFDTSATCANTPAGTTAVRRVGSIKTDPSTNLVSFTQSGAIFYWITAPTADMASVTISTTPTTYSFTNVPPGVKVRPMIRIKSSTSVAVIVASPDELISGTPSGTAVPLDVGTSTTPAELPADKYTDTSQNLYIWNASTAPAITAFARGWIDDRGSNN